MIRINKYIRVSTFKIRFIYSNNIPIHMAFFDIEPLVKKLDEVNNNLMSLMNAIRENSEIQRQILDEVRRKL